VPGSAWIGLLHRFERWRHGKQQNVVGVVAVAVPVAITVLGVHPPPVDAVVTRKSPPELTGSHVYGVTYEMVLPVQVSLVDDDTDTEALHEAPETAPQEHLLHPRPSSTLP
jgi:hypothetical protein